MKKILTLVITFACLLVFGTQSISASGLTFTKGEVKDNFSLIEGVDYEKFIATSTNDDGKEGKQQVNMVTVAPGSAKIVSWAIPNINGIKASTVMDMALDFEAKHPEYMVIAAINNDYFGSDTSTKVFSMRNQSVVDGVVYRDKSIYSNMYCIGIGENNVYKVASRGEVLPTTENYILDIYDPNGLTIIKSVVVDGFNVAPEAGQTTVCYKTNTAITASNAEIFNIDATSKSRITSYFFIAGKANGTAEQTDPETPAVLTTDVEIANYLDSGCQIRVSKKIAGEWSEFESVFGSGAQTLRDGTILSVAEIGDYGTDHVALRHPRTSIGFKEDGTCVLMVIDGRQDNMDGVSERENALALQQLGCVDAFNFDGGGSSTFIIRKNGELTVVNSPSDGYERSDANCLLLVVPRTNIDINAEAVQESDGSVTISGTSNIETLNGFEYSSTEIYLNGVSTGQSAEEFELVGLQPGKTYNLAVMLIYKSGSSNVGRCFYNEDVEAPGEVPDTLTVPKITDVTTEKLTRGFKVNVLVKDPSSAITKMNISYGETTLTARRTTSGYSITIYNDTAKEYVFSLDYSYRTAINNSIDEKEEAVLIYNHNSEPIEPTPTPTPSDFKVILEGLEDGTYQAETTYTANGTTDVNVLVVIDGVEYEITEDTILESKEITSLVVRYTVDGEELSISVSEFELEVNEYQSNPSGDNNSGGSTGGGFSCNMGFVSLLPLVGAAALLLIKKRK